MREVSDPDRQVISRVIVKTMINDMSGRKKGNLKKAVMKVKKKRKEKKIELDKASKSRTLADIWQLKEVFMYYVHIWILYDRFVFGSFLLAIENVQKSYEYT